MTSCFNLVVFDVLLISLIIHDLIQKFRTVEHIVCVISFVAEDKINYCILELIHWVIFIIEKICLYLKI